MRLIPVPKMVDTSNPGTSGLPKGYQAVAGYIGGDTPHIWTAQQWQQFKGVPKLPIYVDDARSAGTAAGEADAWNCLKILFSLGVPRGKAIAYDIETSKDAARADGFNAVMQWAGFVTWLYGSRSTLLTIPFPAYWVADFTQLPHFPTRSSRACQYANEVPVNGLKWDVSVLRRWQFLHRRLWT